MDPPITAKAALLQTLAWTGPGFGLDLIARVKTLTRGTVELGQGSVYPALRDLEQEGLVEACEGEQVLERGGRPRQHYRITERGRRVAKGHAEIVMGLFGGGDG